MPFRPPNPIQSVARVRSEVFPVLFRRTYLATAVMGFTMFGTHCGRDNGLPGDLTEHLARHGITVDVTGSQAPLSSRAGFIFFEPDPETEAKIIAEFDLGKIEPENTLFDSVSARVPAKPEALWGTAGRPEKLKLENGAQLEYLYLLTTVDGPTYLLAEYAYG